MECLDDVALLLETASARCSPVDDVALLLETASARCSSVDDVALLVIDKSTGSLFCLKPPARVAAL